MAKTLDPKPPLDLQARLNRLLPNIRLLATPLPLVPELRLWLLDELVDERLDQEVANALMEAPPYWSLCWASGQVRSVMPNFSVPNSTAVGRVKSTSR